MKFDFTTISDSGGVTLTPGRYLVSTKANWTVSETQSGHMKLYVPFEVLEDGDFQGASSAYYHTIMTSGEPQKIRTNLMYTLRLYSALGLIVDTDRGQNGALEAEFEYGDKDENGRVAVRALIVNGERRTLDGLNAVAVVILDSNTQSGVKVDRLEANGKPVQAKAMPATQQVQQAQATQAPVNAAKGLPF